METKSQSNDLDYLQLAKTTGFACVYVMHEHQGKRVITHTHVNFFGFTHTDGMFYRFW